MLLGAVSSCCNIVNSLTDLPKPIKFCEVLIVGV
jgi:hypothetical protein